MHLVERWMWVAGGVLIWTAAVTVITCIVYAGHGPGRGEARNQVPEPPGSG